MIYIKNVNVTQQIFIPRNELQKEAYNATVKTYEDGYKEGYVDGKEYQKDQLLNLYVTENGEYNRDDGWGIVTVNIPTEDCPECPECEDCNDAYNNGYDEGYNEGYNQGKSECPECPEGDDCNIQIMKQAAFTKTEESRVIQPDFGYEAMKMVVVNTAVLEETKFNEGYESGYTEGYNQGQADCPESGECPEINLEDKWVTPSYNEKDDNGLIVINPSDGFDGLSRVVLDPSTIYNEGVEEGRNQGGGSGECNIQHQKRIDLNGSWEVFYPDEGYDGVFEVVVDASRKEEEWREDGKWDVINKMDSITITENGNYGIDHLTNYPYLDYENLNGYTEFHYTPNDDNFEIEVSYSLGENAVMHLVDIGEYSVELTAGMCYGTKNDERISPEHMSWGDGESRTIHTIKVTREGITLLEDGSFISWGEDLGTISSNIKVGRDFTSKIFTVKINGETFTPEGDGVFRNSFAIGEAARYGELQTSDYPNGFRNVEVNVPSVEDTIKSYRYNPITVEDAGFGSTAENFTVKSDNMYSDANGEWLYDSDYIYIPCTDNRNRIYTSKSVSHITSFPFDNGDYSVGKMVIGDTVKEVNFDGSDLSNLYSITLGQEVKKFYLRNGSLRNLNTIVFRSFSSDFVLDLTNTSVNSTGVLWVTEDCRHTDYILSKLPSGWTTQIITTEISRIL